MSKRSRRKSSMRCDDGSSWWSWKTYGNWGATERRINRGGARAVRKRAAQREIGEAES